MAKRKTFEDEFKKTDEARSRFMAGARECAALSIPDVLPPLNHTQDAEFPKTFSSLGNVGSENMVGRILVSLFPVGIPFFRFMPSPSILANPYLSGDEIGALESMLYGRELQVQNTLELTNFRVAARTALESVLITGNALPVLDDPDPANGRHNFRMRHFRTDQWVPKRDGSGVLLWLITAEKLDVRRIDRKILEKADIKPSDKEEEKTLYTKVELQRDGSWVIQQELNDRIVKERAEKVSPYFPMTYRLLAGEHNARGFISGRIGDLRSHNSLWMSLIDAYSAASKTTPVIDPTRSGGMQASDLTKPNGQPVTGRVSTPGIVDGVAFLQTNKTADWSMCRQGALDIEQSLGKAMLIESQAMPQGDRVTATAVLRIARELEGALGAPYAHIAEDIQIPLVNRVVHVMERENQLVALGDMKDIASVELQTGIAALSRTQELDRLLNAMQILGNIPGAIERMNLEIVADRILRSLMIDTNGLIKTAEQIQAEMQAAQASQLQSAAGNQAIQTIGKMVEERAKQAA